MRKSKIITLLLTFGLLLTSFNMPALAAGNDGNVIYHQVEWQPNPHYPDEIYVQAPTYESGEQGGAGSTFTSLEDAAAYIANKIANWETGIQITVTGSEVEEFATSEYNTLFRNIFDMAVDCAGDYVEYSYAAYGGSIGCLPTYDNKIASFSATYNVTYRTTKDQETTLSAEISSVFAQMNLGGRSDYEKIKVIHRYVCDYVDYDRIHLPMGDNYPMMYTAYAAQFDRTAVCQGYALLTYRYCLEAGIPCRIISGIGNGGKHAWNIVKINGRWYDIDTTWDGQNPETRTNYFLRSDKAFGDHIRNPKYATVDFYRIHPMSSVSYDCVENFAPAISTPNDDLSGTGLDGTVYTQANGTPKVIILVDTENSNGCLDLLSGLSSNTSLRNVDWVVAVVGASDTDSTMQEASAIRTTYDRNELFQISYGAGAHSIMRNYIFKFTSGSFYYPVAVYVDENDTIVHYNMGNSVAAVVEENLAHYLGWQDPDNVQRIVGDVTGNGVVDSADVTAIAKHVSGVSSLDSDAQEAADIDGDGNITQLDYILLTKKIAKLIA